MKIQNLPAEYQHMNRSGSWQGPNPLESWWKELQDGDPKTSMLWLWGYPGRGKTHLLVLSIRAFVLETEKKSLFIESGQLAYEIASDYGRTGAYERYSSWSEPILGIDDLDFERLDPQERRKVVRVLMQRWSRRIPTVVSSPLGVKGLAGVDQGLCSRVASRTVIHLDGRDWRVK